MFRRTCLAALLMGSFGCSFASTIFSLSDIIQKHNKQLPQAAKQAPAFKRADFSGDWKGKCSDGRKDELSIRQDSDAIEFEGMRFELNALNSVTHARKSGSELINVVLKWEEAEKMNIRLSYVNFSPFENNPQLDHGWSHIDLKLEDDMLYVNIASKMSFDRVENFPPEMDSDFSSQCVFERVALSNRK